MEYKMMLYREERKSSMLESETGRLSRHDRHVACAVRGNVATRKYPFCLRNGLWRIARATQT